MTRRRVQRPGGVSVAVNGPGGDRPVVVLRHVLAGSSRELMRTAKALQGTGCCLSTNEAAVLGRCFASWPVPFEDEAAARDFLGDDPIVDAWVADFRSMDQGLIAPWVKERP